MTGKNGTQQQPAVKQQPDASSAIYHKLKKGVGHELVNDTNVHELILMAAQYGAMPRPSSASASERTSEQTVTRWPAACK